MKVLIACEYSGRVRDAFTLLGHEAWSCDILPTESPGNHYQGNVLNILEAGWDLMIAHPPCTFLASSGIHWTLNGKRNPRDTHRAIEFVQALWQAPIEKICIENPIGILPRVIGKATQIIQPYDFGHNETKATCLWLKNLPKLKPTKTVGKRFQLNVDLPPSDDRAKLRSLTYQGIAEAMAEQWGGRRRENYFESLRSKIKKEPF